MCMYVCVFQTLPIPLFIINPLAAAFIYIATSAECAGSINLSTAVKGIYFVKEKQIDETFLHFHVYSMAC